MKQISKKKSIIGLVIFGLVLVMGVVLTFVPMNFGKYDYKSFIKAVSLSDDVYDGLSVSYKIKSTNTNDELKATNKKLGMLLSLKGYKNANVYTSGSDSIRIDIAQPISNNEISNTISYLKTYASGRLEIKSVNTASAKADDTTFVLNGYNDIKEITKQSYKGNFGIKIEFNKAGEEIFKNMIGNKVYMFVDGEAWPNTTYNSIDTTGVTDTKILTLWFSSSEVIDQYYDTLVAGTFAAELDSETIEVSYIKTDCTPLLVISLIMVGLLLAVIVYMIIKYRLLGVMGVCALLLSIMIGIGLIQLFPWIEVGFTSLIAFEALELLASVLLLVFFKNVKSQYILGKSLITSISDAYKSIIDITIVSCTISVITGLIFACLASGEIVTIGTIFIISGVMTAISTLLFNYWLVNSFNGVAPNATKLYGLPQKENK